MPGERLAPQDRRLIAAGLRDGLTYAAIGRRIGRPTSTVTREVTRNGGPRGYDPDQAQRAARRPPHAPGPTAAKGDADLGGRDRRVVEEVAAHSAELLVRAGLPQMMARVLAALFTTDSGSLTAAELTRRLRVSPASISKAVGYLEGQALVRRVRDPHRRAERYVIDEDVWFQAIMASARIDAQISAAWEQGAQRLGATSPAGVRMENMSQFLSHVSEDLVRSVERWRRVYATPVSDDPTAE